MPFGLLSRSLSRLRRRAGRQRGRCRAQRHASGSGWHGHGGTAPRAGRRDQGRPRHDCELCPLLKKPEATPLQNCPLTDVWVRAHMSGTAECTDVWGWIHMSGTAWCSTAEDPRGKKTVVSLASSTQLPPYSDPRWATTPIHRRLPPSGSA